MTATSGAAPPKLTRASSTAPAAKAPAKKKNDDPQVQKMNAILNDALDEHKEHLVCPNPDCKKTGAIVRCGFSRKSGLQNVKCKECNKQSIQLANIIFDSVGVKLDFEGTALTSEPSPQDNLNSVLQSKVKELEAEKAAMTERIQELLDSQKQQSTQIAKLTTQLADQNSTISELSKNIATLTAALSAKPQHPPARPEPVPIEDTAAPAAPEGSVARREILTGPAGNADKPNQAQAQAKGLGQDKNRPQKASWADIAKTKRPSLQTLSENEQNRFKETTKNLAALGFKPVPIQRRKPQAAGTGAAPAPNQEKEKPKPVPVYLGGVPRGPIGKLRAELRKCLPKWSILHISFIGNSATEILCHEPLVDKLVGGMKLLGFRHMPNFDPLKELNTDAATLRGHANCYNRWRWGAESSYSEVSRQWFTAKMEALAKDRPAVKEAADEKRTTTAAKKTLEAGTNKEPEQAPEAPAPEPSNQPAEHTDDQQRPEGETGQ